jgi:hypothetical protein
LRDERRLPGPIELAAHNGQVEPASSETANLGSTRQTIDQRSVVPRSGRSRASRLERTVRPRPARSGHLQMTSQFRKAVVTEARLHRAVRGASRFSHWASGPLFGL